MGRFLYIWPDSTQMGQSAIVIFIKFIMILVSCTFYFELGGIVIEKYITEQI